MVKWSEIVNELLDKWRELVVICGCSDSEAEQDIAQLPRSPPENPLELKRCSACMAREVLDGKYVVQIPLYSSSTETIVYLLDDALVEISEDCGYVVSRDRADVLIELLKDIGFDIEPLSEFLKR